MPTVSYHSQFLNDGIHQKTAQIPWVVYEDVAVEHSARVFHALSVMRQGADLAVQHETAKAVCQNAC